MIIDTKQLFGIKPCLFYSQKYDSSFYMNIHAHNTIEIMYVTKGVMNFITLDKENKEIINPVYQGEFTIIKSNIPHKISFSDTETHVLNLEFESLDNTKKINDLFLFNPYSNQFVKGKKFILDNNGPIILEDNGDVLQTINRIHKCLSSDLSIETFEIQYTLLIAQFISDILNVVESNFSRQKGNYFINKAISFIEQNYKNDICVNDVANKAGCSKTYLEKLFLSEYGISIAKKINEFRIEKAKMYLKNLSISPEAVALAVGFSNYQSFINNFKEITGQKPKEYSKNITEQYNVIHAYKKSFFDDTFNKIMSANFGVGAINLDVKEAIENQDINTIILNQNIDDLNKNTIKSIIDKRKFFFFNIEFIKDNLNILNDMNKCIISNDMFDLFLGIYIPSQNNISNLYSLIDEIHRIIPYSRIIVDLEGYDTKIKNSLVNETYVTDIIDIESELSIQYHKYLNKWVKLSLDKKTYNYSQYEGVFFDNTIK